MGGNTPVVRDEDGRESAPCVQPHCPVCGGVLLPLRGFYRCARCSFSLCLGCEGGDDPSSAHGES